MICTWAYCDFGNTSINCSAPGARRFSRLYLRRWGAETDGSPQGDHWEGDGVRVPGRPLLAGRITSLKAVEMTSRKARCSPWRWRVTGTVWDWRGHLWDQQEPRFLGLDTQFLCPLYSSCSDRGRCLMSLWARHGTPCGLVMGQVPKTPVLPLRLTA